MKGKSKNSPGAKNDVLEAIEEKPKEGHHEAPRRRFLRKSMVLGATGLAAYVSPKMAMARGAGGLSPGPPILPPIPGSNAAALARYNASSEAQAIALYLQTNFPTLQLEASRAMLYPDPADINLPPPTLPEERISLIGESAYQGFLADSFVEANFTAKQISVLGSASRVQLSRDLGRLIHVGQPILAIACCCCCCCCSICSCSSNGGDQGGDVDLEIAAVTFGDPDADYDGGMFFRAFISVDAAGQAVGLVKELETFSLNVISILMISFPGGGSLQTTTIDQEILAAIGPDAYAQQLWGAAPVAG